MFIITAQASHISRLYVISLVNKFYFQLPFDGYLFSHDTSERKQRPGKLRPNAINVQSLGYKYLLCVFGLLGLLLEPLRALKQKEPGFIPGIFFVKVAQFP